MCLTTMNHLFIESVGLEESEGRKCLDSMLFQDSGEMDKIEAAFGIVQKKWIYPSYLLQRREVAWQEDFTDSSTPFGYVRIELDGLHGSNFKLFKWFRTNLNCKEEELGDIIKLKDSTIIEVHKSKASLAMKVLDKQKYNGKSLSYSVNFLIYSSSLF